MITEVKISIKTSQLIKKDHDKMGLFLRMQGWFKS